MTPERRPLSLVGRSALASLLALVAFLGATGFALDRAYTEGTLTAERNRLQSFIYAYLAGFDVSRYGSKLLPPDAPPQPGFARPGSGLYAAVSDARGRAWSSPSAQGLDLPVDQNLDPGITRFEGPLVTASGKVFMLSQGVAWDVPHHHPLKLTFHVAESTAGFDRQISAYRHTLALWLTGLGLVLLLLQQVLMRWSLSPLRRVAIELALVERGQRERLDDDYPHELIRLTRNLNRFIESEREHLQRNRNTLGDLAHSLKTPLAVIRSRLDTEAVPPALTRDVLDQVRRMDEIVAYQLARAAALGHATFSAPIAVAPLAEELVRGLEKVYAARQVLCEFEIEPAARFYGEPGDLLELLGNLTENAFKWAQHRVLVTARVLPGSGAHRDGLELIVEDDGPGIAEDQVERLLQRGVRGDERVQGHGIGLAIVQDLVRAYRAVLTVERSPELGGARFVVRFTQG